MTTSPPPPVHPGPAAPRPRRSRARTALPLAVAAWAVVEIWLLTVVASATSGFTVLLLLLAGFVLGVVAVKRAGRSAWRNLSTQIQPPGPGQAPQPPPAAGRGTGLAFLGGLLLMVPGFLSDVVALPLLFPPTRRLIARAAEKVLERALNRRPSGAPEPGSMGDLFQQARQADEQIRIHRPDGKVIPGEVVDRDER